MTLAAPSRHVTDETTFGLLGTVTVVRAGESVACGGLKQRAVLALLLINANRPLSVERIIDELWGDSPPPTALATLQAYVSNIRRQLEPDRPARSRTNFLQGRCGTYEFTVDPQRVDVLRFEELAAEAQRCRQRDPETARKLLTEALELWRGPALVEFEAFDFAAAEIIRLDELRIAALETRIEVDLALGGGSELVVQIEQLVRLNPLREQLWGHLMRAYYRAGRQAEALRAYRRCESVLAQELGIAPSAELRKLEFAVLEQDPRLATVAGPARRRDVAEPVVSPAIVGRSDELQIFRSAVDRANGGRGTVILIDGEPGIGKTRLLEAMYESAIEMGCSSALARCVEVGGSPPFWPWIQMVRGLGIGTPISTTQHHELAEAIVDAMTGLAGTDPVVGLIDDLYCADPDSLSLLGLVASSIENAAVVLVGTRRTKRPGTPRQLTDVVAQLHRFAWCKRLHLGPLDRDQVKELVHRSAGTDIDEEMVDAIHARSDGNAFFTVELARLLADRHRQCDALPVPDTIRELVGLRLEELPPAGVQLLRAASLVGREFDVVAVADALEIPLREAVNLVDRAVAEGLVDEIEPAGYYRFAHALVNEAIAAELSALRRAHLRERLSNSLGTVVQ